MESHQVFERVNDAAGVEVLGASLHKHVSTVYDWAQDPGNARFRSKPKSRNCLDVLRVIVSVLAGTNTDDSRLAIKHVELFVVRLCRKALERQPRAATSKAEVVALALKAMREVTDTIEECAKEGWTPSERCHRDRLTVEALQARDVLDQLIEVLDTDQSADVKRFPTKPKLDNAS